MRRKTELQRQSLITAAGVIFGNKGFDAASIKEIAVRSGVAKGTVYNYFAGKEELFVAVMMERGARLADPIFEFPKTGDELGPTLLAFARAYLSFVLSEEALAFRRMIIAEGAKFQLSELFFENGVCRIWRRLSAYLTVLMAEGALRGADAWTASMHLQGLCEAGHYYRRLLGAIPTTTQEDIDASARDAIDVFLRAYQSESSVVASVAPQPRPTNRLAAI